MYYTGIDPRTMQEVYVEKDPHRKNMQRALLQYRVPENWRLVREALLEEGREDLIGFDERCLIRPYPPKKRDAAQRRPNRSGGGKTTETVRSVSVSKGKGTAKKQSDAPRKGTTGKKPHRDSRPPKNRKKPR